jgi:hypothetical protein
MSGHLFRVIPEATAHFFTKQFALLQPISFLCLLSSSPDIPPNSNYLELPLVDLPLFQRLQKGQSRFKNAMTLSRKRTKADNGVDE